MMLMSPMDNALFLANVRERCRPVTMAAHALVIAMVWMAVAFVTYNAREFRIGNEWLLIMVNTSIIMQAVLVLLMGTRSVAAMTLRERLTGTLDFHRISPTPVFAQCWGLLLGPAALEWGLTAGLALPATGMWYLAGGDLLKLAEFYACFTLNGLMLHAIAMLAMLRVPKAQAERSQYTVPILLVFVFYMMYSLPASLFGVSVINHLSAWPVYVDLMRGSTRDYIEWSGGAGNGLFGVELPTIVMQFLVQGLMLAFAYVASMRSLEHPEQPMFSKTQNLLVVAYWYALVLNGYQGLASEVGVMGSLRNTTFVGVVAMLGLVMATIATPNASQRLKALRRHRKLGRAMGPLSDGASNRTWLALFAMMSLVLAWRFKLSDDINLLLYAGLSVAYVAWFAGALECFRLSRHRKKNALFVTAMLVPYVFMPLLGLGTLANGGEAGITLMSMFSPVYSIGLGARGVMEDVSESLLMAVMVNTVLAVAMQFFAWRQQRWVDAQV